MYGPKPATNIHNHGGDMRRHLNYANVVATLALVFAMSGGALAANHYLINSTKQVSPKVLKKLTGKTGKTGKTGATGAAGATGPAGLAGKEGSAGAPGSAVGYAAVASDGTVDMSRSKGVISVTNPTAGLYCFDLSFTPKVAVAGANHITSNYTTFAETAAGTADVASFTGACGAPNNDASVVIADGALINDGFYVTFE
jgi:hypothetical protein